MCTAEEVAAAAPATAESPAGDVFSMILCRVALGNPRVVSALEYTKVQSTQRGSRDGWDGWDAVKGVRSASGLNTVPDVPDSSDLTREELVEVVERLAPATGISDEEVSLAVLGGRVPLVALLERVEARWRERFKLPAQAPAEQCDVVMSEPRRAGGIFSLREFAVYDAALTYPEYVLHYRRRLSPPEGEPPQ